MCTPWLTRLIERVSDFWYDEVMEAFTSNAVLPHNLAVVGHTILKLRRIYVCTKATSPGEGGIGGQKFCLFLLPVGDFKREFLGCRMTLHSILSAEENQFAK